MCCCVVFVFDGVDAWLLFGVFVFRSCCCVCVFVFVCCLAVVLFVVDCVVVWLMLFGCCVCCRVAC